MSTRGALGFHFRESDLLSYNHFDSYPTGLGVKTGEFLMSFLEGKNIHDLRAMTEKLIPVKECPPSVITPAMRSRLKSTGIKIVKHSKKELAFGGRPEHVGKINWYSSLRENQGDVGRMLASGVILEANDFIKDSLFCEWAYIINLDYEEIEVYRGFIKRDEPCHGRYSNYMPPPFEVVERRDGTKEQIPNEYRACSLVASFPLNKKGATEFFLACGGNQMEGGVPVLMKGKDGKKERGIFKPLAGHVWNEANGEPFKEEGFTFTFSGKQYVTTQYSYANEVEKNQVKAAA